MMTHTSGICPLHTQSLTSSGDGAPSSVSPSNSDALTHLYGINEHNLAARRTYIRLTEADRELFIRMIPWAEAHAPAIARALYDWKFSFPQTARFFSRYAHQRGMKLATLREHLEAAQTRYITSCFTGARDNWGLAYFETRLHIGRIHDQINLPFKWYVGAYMEYVRVTQQLLERDLHHWQEHQHQREDEERRRQKLRDQERESELKLGGKPGEVSVLPAGAHRSPSPDSALQIPLHNATPTSEADHSASETPEAPEWPIRSQEDVWQVLDVLHKIFNLDLQAIGDSFILSTFNTDITSLIEERNLGVVDDEIESDLTEHIGDLKEATRQAHIQNADYRGQIEAISRSQAIIEFNMDGVILNANENLLRATGYSLDEIQGQHHRIFVTPDYAESDEYAQFWAALRRGEYQVAEFERVRKDNEAVWIQASYNPIMGTDGQYVKVVKYATDITEQVRARQHLQDSMHRISTNAMQLSDASNQLSTVSERMSVNAEGTSGRASNVATASQQVNENVQTVATSAEEMSASIQEVARSAGEAARISAEAVQTAEAANTTMTRLGLSSAEVEGVVQLITSIAQQTKLLALNATIEAARAGEAGRGFAVVASEVKELAQQTAEATKEIGDRVQAIQTSSGDAMTAIDQITSIISQINDIQGTIASAVEEQSTTTNEIARSAHLAAAGSNDIAENIKEVARAAEDTAIGAADNQEASHALARMAAEVQEIIANFQD